VLTIWGGKSRYCDGITRRGFLGIGGLVVGGVLTLPEILRAEARRGAATRFFPLAGNGGYDVTHYSLTLDYSPARYPFDAVGAIVDDAKVVGYSLETQTKPVFDRMPNEATLAHELSHMWYGDSVTLTTWPDIWLHEGFATWSEWIWSEHEGNKSAAKWFNELYNRPAQDIRFWGGLRDPGSAAFLFNGTIYYRGG